MALGWAVGTAAIRFNRQNQEAPPLVPTREETRPATRSLLDWVAMREPASRTATSLEDYQHAMAAFRASEHCGSARQQIERTLFFRGLGDDLIRQILLEEASPNIPGSDLNRMISNVAKQSPQDAMQFVDELELENRLSIYELLGMRSAVNKQWLEQDPAAAVDYALVRTRKDAYALNYLMNNWCWSDPGAAMRTVAELPEAPNVSATDIFKQWIEKDRSNAIAWMESESPAAIREQLRSVLQQHEYVEPWRRISALTRSGDTNHELEQAWVGWFGSDPKAAVAKLNELEARAPDADSLTAERKIIAAARRADFVWDYSEAPKDQLLTDFTPLELPFLSL